tara:strand:+ start:543 stop:848 length:306 start_codon:yes stop_codon:yes gene_type:complete
MSDIYAVSFAMFVVGYSIGLYYLFNHFTMITNHQLDLTDKILTKLFPPAEEKEYISELDKKLSKDKANIEGLGDGKTHIYGGKTVSGHGVCRDDCWCLEDE